MYFLQLGHCATPDKEESALRGLLLGTGGVILF